jgi:glycosyltransferase involved in cell wall biosynthesis
MKTKILFDLEAAQPAIDGSPHGGGEYARVVFARLAEVNSGAEITAIYNPSKCLDPTLKAFAGQVKIELVKINDIGEFQKLINKNNFHKFYSSSPRKYYDSDLKSLRVIFTIHGLRRIEKEEGRIPSSSTPLRQVIRSLLRRFINRGTFNTRKEKDRKLVNIKSAKFNIVVPSLHTKYNLINTFPELSEIDIRVLYSPIPFLVNKEILGDCQIILNNFDLQSRQFFLLVNARRSEKNAQFGMQALDNVFTRFPSLKKSVLVVGADDKHPRVEGLQNRDCFKLIDYIERSRLECLYKEAFALIFPSLDEGFGYPPLECMRYGTPVLCSVNTSMAEIYSGAALFFNPLMLKELEIRILTILLEKKIWDEYSLKGLKRYREVHTRQNQDLEALVNLILSPL